jgi:hypothetical protein
MKLIKEEEVCFYALIFYHRDLFCKKYNICNKSNIKMPKYIIKKKVKL